MKKIGILCPSDTELRPFLPHIKAAKITEKAMLKILNKNLTIALLPVKINSRPRHSF